MIDIENSYLKLIDSISLSFEKSRRKYATNDGYAWNFKF